MTTGRGSVVTPVWRPNMNVVSTTASASAKAWSGAPTSSLRSKQRLSPSEAWITGVLASSAVSGSVTAGRGWYFTSTSSQASSACARVRATTAHTASPCQQARSKAIACCGADFRPFRWVSTPTQGVITLVNSAPVTTAITPGAFMALSVVVLTMRAWACDERTNATCVMRGTLTSLTYCPRPCVRRCKFGRGTERPM